MSYDNSFEILFLSIHKSPTFTLRLLCIDIYVGRFELHFDSCSKPKDGCHIFTDYTESMKLLFLTNMALSLKWNGMKRNIYIFFKEHLPLDGHKWNLGHFFCATNVLFMTSFYQIFHISKFVMPWVHWRSIFSSFSCSFRQNYAK